MAKFAHSQSLTEKAANLSTSDPQKVQKFPDISPQLIESFLPKVLQSLSDAIDWCVGPQLYFIIYTTYTTYSFVRPPFSENSFGGCRKFFAQLWPLPF